MRLLVAAVTLLVAAAPLHGQMVMTNDTLDTEQREVRDILVLLRDSLHTVQAAAAQFGRGHASASNELLYSRGIAIKSACLRSLRNIEPARNIVKADEWGDEYRTGQQTQLLAAMNDLQQSLNACESVWDRLATTEYPDDIRTEGPQAARSIANDINAYTTFVSGYYRALGIYVRPIGAY